MTCFPYPPRPGQERIIELSALAVASHTHLVLEAPTGTGKTAAALAGVLDGLDSLHDRRTRRVLYLTRTNSQQRQVMVELRKMADARPTFAVAVQGRVRSCFLSEEDAELAACDTEEHSRLCSDRKRHTVSTGPQPGECRFYRSLMNYPKPQLEAHARSELPTFEELSEWSRDRELCAYEANKLLLKDAEVVCAPYVYFFHPFIRRRLLEWMGVSISDLVVVLDEAHNLPDYAREIASMRLTNETLEQSIIECALIGDPDVLPGVAASDALTRVQQALRAMAESYIIDDDGLVPPGAFEAELMAAFATTSTRLGTMAKTMEVFGEQVRSLRQSERKVPRSYLRAVGGFIGAYFQNESDTHAKLVSTPDSWRDRARRPALELYCLDPAISCGPLLDTAASIHMSGTMRPLTAYRDTVGLPRDTELLEVASPFPPENRLVVYSPKVTSRFEAMRVDPTMERRLHEEVVAVVRENERNTAVFFPSHRALASFAAWSAPLFERHRLTFVEEAGMDQEQLMTLLARFKEPTKSSREAGPRGKVLLAVMGGRLSEGVDFPDASLEVVVVPGIPYPKPNARTKSLVDYFDRKFGRGWEYAVEVPTSRRLLQAVGRVIRGPSDVGGVAVLDYRAAQFADRIEGLRRSDNPAGDIRGHLESRSVPAPRSATAARGSAKR